MMFSTTLIGIANNTPPQQRALYCPASEDGALSSELDQKLKNERRLRGSHYDDKEVEATSTEDAFVLSLASVLTHLVSFNTTDRCQVTRFHAVKAPDISIRDYLNRLLITAVMLAAKFFDDVYYSNAFYARVGGVRTQEINLLEWQFLVLIKYRLFVTSKEYDQYRQNVLIAINCGIQKVPTQNPTDLNLYYFKDAGQTDNTCPSPISDLGTPRTQNDLRQYSDKSSMSRMYESSSDELFCSQNDDQNETSSSSSSSSSSKVQQVAATIRSANSLVAEVTEFQNYNRRDILGIPTNHSIQAKSTINPILKNKKILLQAERRISTSIDDHHKCASATILLGSSIEPKCQHNIPSGTASIAASQQLRIDLLMTGQKIEKTVNPQLEKQKKKNHLSSPFDHEVSRSRDMRSHNVSYREFLKVPIPEPESQSCSTVRNSFDFTNDICCDGACQKFEAHSSKAGPIRPIRNNGVDCVPLYVVSAAAAAPSRNPRSYSNFPYNMPTQISTKAGPLMCRQQQQQQQPVGRVVVDQYSATLKCPAPPLLSSRLKKNLFTGQGVFTKKLLKGNVEPEGSFCRDSSRQNWQNSENPPPSLLLNIRHDYRASPKSEW